MVGLFFALFGKDVSVIQKTLGSGKDLGTWLLNATLFLTFTQRLVERSWIISFVEKG